MRGEREQEPTVAMCCPRPSETTPDFTLEAALLAYLTEPLAKI